MSTEQEPMGGAHRPSLTHLPRPLAVGLCSIVLVSVVGTVSSVVPSMSFHSEGTDVVYEYGLSVLIAPALFAVIAILAVRALRPSRKRLLSAAWTMLGASPFLFGIRLAREPLFDIDDEFDVLAPWALHTYVACAALTLVGGLALSVYARRLGPDASIPVARARIAEHPGAE